MSSRAFAYVCNIRFAPRAVASIRALHAAGALDDAGVYALCLDDDTEPVLLQALAGLPVTTLSYHAIPAFDALSERRMSEIAFASKPLLMRWIMQHTDAEQVIYVDSDIWFAGSPAFMFDLLETHNILLIPYMVDPHIVTSDWETVVRNAQRTGYYNAGLVGANRRALPFLDWWAERCQHSTGVDFYEDISGDQKYLNWVPSVFSGTHVVRHYGVNIKPWLIDYIPFERGAHGITVNGDPAIYFHFSQNLGNLLNWPEILYPEVSRYLEELERARIDCGEPFVDMSERDNADFTRPLLPRTGKQAMLLRLMQSYRQPIDWVRERTERAAMSIVRRLPGEVKWRIARRTLGSRIAGGDVTVDTCTAVARRLRTSEVDRALFVGASRLALALAYSGHRVDMYAPFQGFFNQALNQPFNPQWPATLRIRDRLGLNESLALHRVPITDAQRATPAPLVAVSARYEADFIADVVTTLASAPTVRYLLVLFNEAWPAAYRDTYREAVRAWLGERYAAPEALGDADLYTLAPPDKASG